MLNLRELNRFLGEAALNTYIGGGKAVDPEDAEAGMQELKYMDGDWEYKDSYSGFFQSWGREMIWHKRVPVWAQVYGGGMRPEFHNDMETTHMTFDFLKQAMKQGDKVKRFQPRGPAVFEKGEWKYVCKADGSIKKFKGNEKIMFRGKVVFTHDFFGGLFVCKGF